MNINITNIARYLEQLPCNCVFLCQTHQTQTALSTFQVRKMQMPGTCSPNSWRWSHWLRRSQEFLFVKQGSLRGDLLEAKKHGCKSCRQKKGLLGEYVRNLGLWVFAWSLQKDHPCFVWIGILGVRGGHCGNPTLKGTLVDLFSNRKRKGRQDMAKIHLHWLAGKLTQARQGQKQDAGNSTWGDWTQDCSSCHFSVRFSQRPSISSKNSSWKIGFCVVYLKTSHGTPLGHQQDKLSDDLHVL